MRRAGSAWLGTALCLAISAAPTRAATPAASNARAHAALQRIVSTAPAIPAGRALEIIFEGTLKLEGHFRRPGETRRYHSRQRYLSNGRGGMRLEWSTWADGDTVIEPETYLCTGGVVYHRDAPGAPWQRYDADRAAQAVLVTAAGMPWELARDLDTRGARQRSDGAFEGSAGSHARVMRRSRSGGRATAVDDLLAHPRLGDVADAVRWDYGRTAIPESLALTTYQRDSGWELHAHRVGAARDVAADTLFDRPAASTPAAAEDAIARAPELTRVAPGVWTVDMPDLDTRSLVVEFADGLAVIEAAVGSANGERIVDTVREHWPAKPIRWFLFSHHHPHYVGGVRAFVAAGATVVTTPGNVALVRVLASRPFTRAPDRLVRAPRAADIVPFTGRWELADSTQRLVAVDIGARSDHTDEFVVFWLPRAGVVFETEQGWVDAGGGKPRASRRARRFLQTLDEEHLAAATLIQSWPMRGLPRTMARDSLAALLPPPRP